MKKPTGSINLTLNSADQKRLLDSVILNAYSHFWGVSPEQELSMEVLHRQLPAELDLEKIRKDYNNEDLDEQLKILEVYIQNVLNDPYSGDLGAGCSRFMEVRYINKHRFAELAWSFRNRAVSMYVDLWRIVLGDLLPPCSEEEQICLSADLPCNRKAPQKNRPEIETQILMVKYPHFYELMKDPAALAKFFEGLKEVAGVSEIPDVLDPTMGFYEVFGIDSLDTFELMTWYEDEFEFSEIDPYPKNNSLGEWARIIMTCRTI